MMNQDIIIDRINHIIEIGKEAIQKGNMDTHHTFWAEPQQFAYFRASGLSVIRDVFGIRHPIYTDFTNNTKNPLVFATRQGIGLLNAAKTEIEKGWLLTVKSLLSSEVFSDYLDMSLHLVEEGFKDAAAVMIGAVLEKHLKDLSVEKEIPLEQKSKNGKIIPKKTDTLNAELARMNAYSKLDQKTVTAWLGIRNHAAHGNYDEYNVEQVRIMHLGVKEFIARTIGK